MSAFNGNSYNLQQSWSQNHHFGQTNIRMNDAKCFGKNNNGNKRKSFPFELNSHRKSKNQKTKPHVKLYVRKYPVRAVDANGRKSRARLNVKIEALGIVLLAVCRPEYERNSRWYMILNNSEWADAILNEMKNKYIFITLAIHYYSAPSLPLPALALLLFLLIIVV